MPYKFPPSQSDAFKSHIFCSAAQITVQKTLSNRQPSMPVTSKCINPPHAAKKPTLTKTKPQQQQYNKVGKGKKTNEQHWSMGVSCWHYHRRIQVQNMWQSIQSKIQLEQALIPTPGQNTIILELWVCHKQPIHVVIPQAEVH